MNKESQTSYNKWGFYIFLGTLGFSCLWVLYFTMIANSIDRGEYEESSSAQSEELKKEEPEKEEVEKPWITSEQLVAQGAKIYSAQCAVCHGAKGLGDGTPGLIPPPRNLVEGKWKLGGSSKELFITLEKGIEGTSMISYQHLPAVDLWALVHYIRSITNNKVEDDKKELEEFATAEDL